MFLFATRSRHLCHLTFHVAVAVTVENILKYNCAYDSNDALRSTAFPILPLVVHSVGCVLEHTTLSMKLL